MDPALERLRRDDEAGDAFVAGSETNFPLQMSARAEGKAPSGWCRLVQAVTDASGRG